jgi:hypothetical protein
MPGAAIGQCLSMLGRDLDPEPDKDGTHDFSLPAAYPGQVLYDASKWADRKRDKRRVQRAQRDKDQSENRKLKKDRTSFGMHELRHEGEKK